MPMGRSFGPSDTAESQRVAIINESLSRMLFGGEPPLGKRFYLAGRKNAFEVVGVVKDARYDGLREKPRPVWYLYTEQEQDGFNDLVIRVEGNPAALISQVRQAIRDQDPNVA